jgi:hypothetical protein
MLSPELLKEQIGRYDSGKISLGQFEDWFYEVSVDPMRDSDLAELVDEIDSALSARHFAGLGQHALRQQLRGLANAVLPFALRADTARVVYQLPRNSIAVTAAAAIALSIGPVIAPVLAPSNSALTVASPSLDIALVNSSIPLLVEAEASVS